VNTEKEPLRIVLLIGGGSCVPWVYEVLDQSLAKVVLAISHKKVSKGLDVVRKNNGDTLLLPFLSFKSNFRANDVAYFETVYTLVASKKPDLVLCLGWDLILSSWFMNKMYKRNIPVVNLHPALISENGQPIKTEFGTVPVIKGEVADVMKEIIERKLSAAGASLHLIPKNAEVDQGPVLLRSVIKVLEKDTPETLEKRVHAEEKNPCAGSHQDISEHRKTTRADWLIRLNPATRQLGEIQTAGCFLNFCLYSFHFYIISER